MTRERAQELFSGTAPRYRDTPGLIRKYYLLSPDGATAGGVYLWKTQEDAERLYTADWRQFIARTYGAEPSLVFFETPSSCDNLAGGIIKDP